MPPNASQPVVFTDLDGTLIDFETYSSEVAKPALVALLDAGIPVIFCSSKTRVEQRALMDEIGFAVPAIVENGSGLFFPPEVHYPWIQALGPNDLGLVSLGVPAAEISDSVSQIETVLGLDLRPFSRLENRELMEMTGLSIEGARRARQRDFSETLAADLSQATWRAVEEALAEHGLACAHGGRFHTVTCNTCDKGRALQRVMSTIGRTCHGSVHAVAIGDSTNDIPMLAAADQPYLVQRPDGTWHPIETPGLCRVDGIGPHGWVRIAGELLASVGK